MYSQNSRKVLLLHLKTKLTLSAESESKGAGSTWSESLDELLEVLTEFFFLTSFVIGDFQTFNDP